jgi:hypothetical protein
VPRPSSPPAVAAPLAALVLATLAGPAAAQQIWKSTGPDGRTVYSDHPPVSSSAPSRILNRTPSPTPVITAAASADAAAGDRATASDADPPGPRTTATAARPAAPVAASVPAAPVPATPLAAAVVGVLGEAERAQRFRDACERAEPAAAPGWSAAHNGWKLRNAQYVSQAGRVLAIAYAPPVRAGIAARVDAEATQWMTEYESGAPAVRLAWCNRVAADLLHGRADVKAREAWVDPLMSWTGR